MAAPGSRSARDETEGGRGREGKGTGREGAGVTAEAGVRPLAGFAQPFCSFMQVIILFYYFRSSASSQLVAFSGGASLVGCNRAREELNSRALPTNRVPGWHGVLNRLFKSHIRFPVRSQGWRRWARRGPPCGQVWPARVVQLTTELHLRLCPLTNRLLARTRPQACPVVDFSLLSRVMGRVNLHILGQQLDICDKVVYRVQAFRFFYSDRSERWNVFSPQQPCFGHFG